jgi:hypothetical protein
MKKLLEAGGKGVLLNRYYDGLNYNIAMLRIIQVSDLHMDVERNESGAVVPTPNVEGIITSFLEDLETYLDADDLNSKGLEPLLFFVGDAINQGGLSVKELGIKPKEVFDCFNEHFIQRIVKEHPCLKDRIFITPGNHDITGKATEPVKAGVLRIVRESPPKAYIDFSKTIRDYNPPKRSKRLIPWMSYYLTLEETVYKDYPKAKLTNLVNTFKVIPPGVNGGKERIVAISCLNTAWLSYIPLEEVDGANVKDVKQPSHKPQMAKFVLTENVWEAAKTDLAHIADADVKIFASHYPGEDLLDFSLTKIGEEIRNRYDMVLNGHTHRLKTTLEDSANNFTETLFSSSESALHVTRGLDQSGYKIIDYYDGKRYEVHHRAYDGEHNRYVAHLKLAADEGIKTFYLKGGLFIEGAIEDVMRGTIKRLKTGSSMRVVGIGRQDAATENETIEDYYTAIERRLSSKKPFTLQRLTSTEMKPLFKSHLQRSFAHADRNDHSKMELAFLNDWHVRFTYYIIDDDYIVINIYQRGADSAWDCPYAYVSTNRVTIAPFIRLFEDTWAEKKAKNELLDSLGEFKRLSEFNEKVLNIYKRLGSLLYQIPNDSIRYVSMDNEIDELEKRIDDIERDVLHHVFDSETSNHNTFLNSLDFLSTLPDGGSYRAVSFYEFWDSLSPKTQDKFMASNERVVNTDKSVIRRVYVVNRDRMRTDRKYLNDHKKLIAKHLRIKHPNYHFNLLFLDNDDYNKALKDNTNFALWKSATEGALLMLYYNMQQAPAGKPKAGEPSLTDVLPKGSLSESDLKIFKLDDRNRPAAAIQNKADYEEYELKFSKVMDQQAKQGRKPRPEDLVFLQAWGLNDDEINWLIVPRD